MKYEYIFMIYVHIFIKSWWKQQQATQTMECMPACVAVLPTRQSVSAYINLH